MNQLRRAITTSLSLGLISIPHWAQAAGDHGAEGVFSTMKPPVPNANAETIEIVEFFWYGCPHCFKVDPMVNVWEKKLSADVSAESSLKCNGFGSKRVPLGEFGLHDFGIDLARSSKVEDLARPVIEHGFDVGELLGRDGGQVGALGQELANQAVHVLVGAALPGAVGFAEEHGHAGGGGEFEVAGHLGAAVVGEALAQLGDDLVEAPGEAFEGVGGGAAVHLGEQHEAAVALDGGADGAGVARTLDEVALPVAGYQPGVGLCGALAQRHEVGDVAALAAGAARTRHALGVALAQLGDDFGAQLATGHHVDGLVDGLVRDALSGVFGVHALEPASDLFGRQGALEFVAYELAQRGVESGAELAHAGLGLDTALAGLLLGASGQVAPFRVLIARQFPADGRGRAAELLGDLTLGQLLRDQQPKLCALLDAQA